MCQFRQSLDRVTQNRLSDWMELAKAEALPGVVLARIEPLATADPNWFAVHICTESQSQGCGDTARRFPLMSVIKPFLWLAVLDHYGGAPVAQWVGTQPSDLPFNSLVQLQADGGRPRNPMINSGAITLADRLPGATARQRCEGLCEWLNRQAGCQLSLDEEVLEAVRQSDRTPNLNLLAVLSQSEAVQDPDLALDTYEQICCLSGQVSDLAQLGLLLAVGEQVPAEHRQLINAVMLTCGLYEDSHRYALQIGLPMKSGVSGAVLAVVPRQGAIACYSPPLDLAGNSGRSLTLITHMARDLGLHLLG